MNSTWPEFKKEIAALIKIIFNEMYIICTKKIDIKIQTHP